IYSGELENVVRDNVKVQVYLKNQLSKEQTKKIENQLKVKKFVKKGGNDASIEFVSKETAAKQFIKETGEDFKRFLGENPLRNAFLVKIDPAYQDKSSLTKIKAEIEKIPGVFQAYYVENVIDSINQNVAKIGLVLIGLVAILLVTVVLLINNTVRLALFSQRFIIRSMQLVGAKRWFIQRPFLFQAMWHGALAGFLSCTLLYALVSFATTKIEDLALIQNTQRLYLLAGSLLITGVVVATISTYRAIGKYLRLSLDELF
ncbi:MAG: permease-like cell division protein FtsX, partial [Cyclobacteriaceae bacterium]|nr:permease-like cell division protein FtsX [Cyclobacteriaceae bacterium]